ncbi:MAG TPA: hypothetical protein PLE90_02780 [Dysgonamonadaceae bacterium]|jgi:hypothetical protein|nr:hypothetical protein [Dysgonamonadaceae bacterium]
MKSDKTTSLVRINVAIGLISAAIIAFQLILMQILSYVQWYHFAYMIISIALLGFGAAGTFLTIFQQKLEKNYYTLFPFLLIVTAILIPVVVGIANSEAVRFDSLLIFQDSRHIGKLILTYFIFFLPFLTGALAIGMSFSKFADQIGKIYFSNLIGSGIGGIIAIFFMQWIIPEQQSFAVAILAFVGGIVSLPKNKKKLIRIIVPLSTLILIILFFYPPRLTPSEYKDISKTMLLPDAKVEYRKSTPHGFVEIVSSPVLRYAPGVSLAYRDSFPVRKVVFNNGNWMGCLLPQPLEANETNILDYTPQALPYHIENIKNALIINAGTGENVLLALSHQVARITANETNPEIFNILRQSFEGFYQVQPYQTMPRTLLTPDTNKYDLIELPIVGSFFGNSGLNAVEPRYELTIEALREMWNKLSEKGMISLSCWMDYPVRNAYRLLATISLLLDENDIAHPPHHVVAIRSWCAITFLVKKSPFKRDEINKVRLFCENRMFDPLVLPEKQEIERDKYNILQDTTFFTHIDQLLSHEKETVIRQYPYRIHPTTDDRPFFFQFVRFKQIPQLISSIREKNFPFLDIGYVLIILTFVQIVFIAAIFILLPLSFRPWKSRNKKWVLMYFSGLGVAYMFLEMVFIQHFTFYFGEPTYAASATLGILLFTSGLGSYYSGKFQNNKKMRLAIPLVIAAILVLYAFVLSPILTATIGIALPLKITIAVVLLGTLGFFLGMPFPIGIDYLSGKNTDDIPWAWALNGYFSVISTVLATIISVELGYLLLLSMAAFIYALVSISNVWIKA